MGRGTSARRSPRSLGRERSSGKAAREAEYEAAPRDGAAHAAFSTCGMDRFMTVARALISVSDKTGLLEFARGLAGLGIEILSTGGTASLLAKEGIAVQQVQDFTGAPEMLGGRVKTLHPKVHGGILARRKLASDQADMQKQGVQPIDLVVVNLYPFREAVGKGLPYEEVIENIDIGGPSMIRSAAKNDEYVTVVVDPADYGMVLAELQPARPPRCSAARSCASSSMPTRRTC